MFRAPKITLLSLVFLLFFPALLSAQEKGLWSSFSLWNPVKHRLFAPLEENIPGLELKGYLQNDSFFTLHRDVHKETNLPGTDITTQKIEWYPELEIRYRPTNKLNFTGIFSFLYNAAYDWDKRFKDAFKTSEREIEYYRTNKKIMRELYVDYISRNWQVRLGKQQVIWGKVDGRRLLDIVNPQDFTRFPLPPSVNPLLGVENTTLPVWMANIQYFWGNQNLQFLWIPDFEPAWGPIGGSIWQFNPRKRPPLPPFIRINLLETDKPPFSLDNSEWGVRWQLIKNGWDITLNYLYSFNDMPTFFTTTILPRGRPSAVNPIRIVLRPEHTRIHQWGGSIEKTWEMFGRQFALKFEGVYTADKYFETVQPRPFLDNQEKKDSFLGGIQLDTYIFRDWNVILRFDEGRIFNYHRGLKTLPIGRKLVRNQEGIFFSILKAFDITHDRLVMRNLVAFLEDEGWRWEPQFSFELTEFLTLHAGAHIFWGDQDGAIGQFNKTDGIELGIRYSF